MADNTMSRGENTSNESARDAESAATVRWRMDALTYRFWMPFLLVIVGGIYWAYFIREPVKFTYPYDTDFYLTGTKSLAEGQGYRLVTHQGAPRLSLYPPLQSAYLAVFWNLGGGSYPGNLRWLLAGMALVSLATVSVLQLLCVRCGAGWRYSTLLACAIGLSPNWIHFLPKFYSDYLGTLFVAILLLLWETESFRHSKNRWLVTGILLALIYLARVAAIAFIGGVFVMLWFTERNRRLILSIQLLLPFLLAWGVCKALMNAGSTGGYISFIPGMIKQSGFGSYVAQCSWQAWQYLSGLQLVDLTVPALARASGQPTVQSLGVSWLAQVVHYGAGLGLMFGIFWVTWNRQNSRFRVYGFIVALYLAMIIITPFFAGYRYLILLLPWFLAGLAAAISRMESWMPVWRSKTNFILTAGLLGIIGLNLALIPTEVKRLKTEGPWDGYQDILRWVQTRTSPESPLYVEDGFPFFQLHTDTGRLLEKEAKFFTAVHHWFSNGRAVPTGNPPIILLETLSLPDFLSRNRPISAQIEVIYQSPDKFYSVCSLKRQAQ